MKLFKKKKKAICPTTETLPMDFSSLHICNFNGFDVSTSKMHGSSSEHLNIFGCSLADKNLLLEQAETNSGKGQTIAIVEKKSEVAFRNLYPDANFAKIFSTPVPAIHYAIENQIQSVILLCQSDEMQNFLRVIFHAIDFHGDLYILSNHKGWISYKRENFGKPLLVIETPCAGTNRITPQVQYLLSKFNLNMTRDDSLLIDLKHYYRQDHLERLLWTDKAKFLHYYMLTADVYSAIFYHNFFSLETLANQKDYRVLIYIRDPRDIINSNYWYLNWSRSESESDRTRDINRFIDGWIETYPDEDRPRVFRWPSLKQFIEIEEIARSAHNIETLSFEDIHYDNVKAIQKAFKNLNILPHLLYDFTDKDWEHVTEISSFEFQSKNQRKRGEFNAPPRTLKQYSCRKGIVGDWKNTFTPASIDYMKKVLGDETYGKLVAWYGE